MMSKNKPTHPGEFIQADILDEFHMTQDQLAGAIGVSRRTINELINERRGVSADIALRLAKFTKTSPEVWLNLQTAYDLWEASHEPSKVSLLKSIRPCVA